jgi:hypothetical protein
MISLSFSAFQFTCGIIILEGFSICNDYLKKYYNLDDTLEKFG